MIDRILSFGATFDWITPAASLLQDILNGPSCGFGVPADAGFSARNIERLLTAKGVKTWGLMVVDDLIIFRVRRAQARWAKYLLERARVPILYAPRDAGNAKPGKSRRQPGFIKAFDGIARNLDRLHGDQS
jgi:hypothetical protein